MKQFILIFFAASVVFAKAKPVKSTIKEVTVYLSGAQITRNANFNLVSGTNEIVFTGLSHKIDESSIQVSGLQAVSILSIAYDTNYLTKVESNPEVAVWETDIEQLEQKIALLKNVITGLEEEELVITSNRTVSTRVKPIELEKLKEISSYYRERITAIKDEIFKHNNTINAHKQEINSLRKQLAEANNSPEKQQGEITIKFDAPIAMAINLQLSFIINDAGWVPNYDIKSAALGAPLKLAYKANVYQKSGQDWNNTKITLSTEMPYTNVVKPNLNAHYLNFTSPYSNRYKKAVQKKSGYGYNPNVKKVSGTITDESGAPLPGANVTVKGTSYGTQTDFDGNYTLEVPNGKSLEFSYLGFTTQEVPVYSSIINLNLEEDRSALDEVVVIGYGTTRKKDLTGSITSVASESLQGRTPGIRIRGASSIKSKAVVSPKPLYVIDGLLVDDFQEGDLDMNEIHEVEVLDKQNATAIYGSRATAGVIVVTTKKSSLKEDSAITQFVIKKPYTIVSDGDITAIEINTHTLEADYEYYAAPIVNENVFLTASVKKWENLQLMPGEASIYFEGTYAGKTVINPYITDKEMVVSMGIAPNITVKREQERNFKSKSFAGANRILNRKYSLAVKNNKNHAISLRLLDRIPKSQNKAIKVEDVVTNSAEYNKDKGILTWTMNLEPQQSKEETFSFL